MESVQARPRKRKKIFLVNRDFQFRYTGAAVVVGMLSTILTLVIVLYPLYQFEILRIPLFLPGPILFVMAGAAVVNIFFVGLMGVIVTHKIAGPMYSMVRHMRRVEHGMWHGQMGLREGDELRFLVRNFNTMLQALNKAGWDDLSELESIGQDLQSADKSERDRISAAAGALEEVARRLKKRINYRLETPK